MMRFDIALALTLAAVPAAGRPRVPLPGADGLVLKTFAGPGADYAAVERIQVFLPGKKPKAIKIGVTAAADGRARLDVYGKKKTVVFSQFRSAAQREKPEAALARLRTVYDLAVSTGGVVAKRKTWKISLRLKSGVLRRALWVDRESGLLMKRETYRDDGTLSRRERLVKLEMPSQIDAASLTGPITPWAPDGFALIEDSPGRRLWSNGLENYELARGADGKWRASGDLAEDDAALALAASEK